MSQTEHAMTENDVIALVEKYLKPHQPPDYKLKISPEGIRRDDDWWYVVVQPDKEDVRSYDYYGRLTEAELDLQEKEHVNVLLVPVLPG
ncbi:MAG: hypothetical protein ACHRHE_18195 [Tepidisphaerales bacterium]